MKICAQQKASLSEEAPRLDGAAGVADLPDVDQELKKTIIRLSHAQDDYWAFPATTDRSDAHGYFQYPAMMVPTMQRALLDSIRSLQPVRSVLDPFAGSGTLVVEAMYAGLGVTAQDINPLAVLLCKTKASVPLTADRLEELLLALFARASADPSKCIESKFVNWQKWFTAHHALQLSRLQRAIRCFSTLWVRRFFWVALAETVRLTSNSRTSTYKLHVRASDDPPPEPNAIFPMIAFRNLDRYREFSVELAGKPRGVAKVSLRDSCRRISGQYDLLMTSPPYGDNTTTVPYGQSAYLPLRWIDLPDIDDNATTSFLASTHEIDVRSLGGRRRRGDLEVAYDSLLKHSSTLRETIRALMSEPRDRRARVLAFTEDLERAISSASAALRGNAYSIWTLGNRCVGGVEIPLDLIVRELLDVHGSQHVLTVRRRIPVKRMALRNSVTDTMRTETILVTRRLPTAREGSRKAPSEGTRAS